MKCKVVSFFLAITLFFTCSAPVMALDIDADIVANTQGTSTSEESNETSAGGYLWKSAFKLVKWALVKADNTLFNRDPTIIDDDGNWVASSSGSVSFGNDSDDVRRVKFTTKVSTAHNRLDVYAQTSVTGWLETITIFIEDSSGDEVYGGQVTHDQHIFTSKDIPLDTYTTYYVYNKNRKWDCWICRYDFTDDQSRSADSSDIVPNMVFNTYTQKSYVVPSDSLFQSSNVEREQNILTAQDLVDEFYDEHLKCSVNRMKNYDVGDTIYVTDVITDLEYNPSTGITILYFGNTSDGPFSWPFYGDLRNQFKANDELTFEFHVVEEYSTNEFSFESLDYFVETYGLISKCSAAYIEDYIVR